MKDNVNIRCLEDTFEVKKATEEWAEEEFGILWHAERMQANFEGRKIELIAWERYLIPKPWSDIRLPKHEIAGAVAASTIPKETLAKYLLYVGLGFGIDVYKQENRLFNISIESRDLSDLKERVAVGDCYKQLLASELGALGLDPGLAQSLPHFKTFLKEWTDLLNGGDAGKTTLQPELAKNVKRLASYAKREAFTIVYHNDIGQRGNDMYIGKELLSGHWIPLVWRGRHQDLLDESNSQSGDKIHMPGTLFKYLWKHQPEPVELSLEMPGVGIVNLNSGKINLQQSTPVGEPISGEALPFYAVAMKMRRLYRDADTLKKVGDNINTLLGIVEVVWSKYGGPERKQE